MAMSDYVVPLLEKKGWQEFWDNMPQSAARALAPGHTASPIPTVIVRAKNQKDAAIIAQTENPGFFAIEDAIFRTP
jgi:hypothetical protein